ncbi:MAG: hypothetical protein GWO20_18130, partial [Candidatus Korarchaeota archaeon]|nr:hypothetical protein [Candidatus Korarchaeota archaeon]NIU00010.1 hypothetical protein [Nitrosopumilaceae archaeon]NIX60612.1 hypothetical protein [Nitrosopumilaceae archaeon]
ILRPYRFSEESLKAEEIHRSSMGWTFIYIYPDGEFADVTYDDGTEVQSVPVDTLDINLDQLECGYKYIKTEDGGIELLEQELVLDDDINDEGNYKNTGKKLKDKESKKIGDDTWVEVESDKIDD